MKFKCSVILCILTTLFISMVSYARETAIADKVACYWGKDSNGWYLINERGNTRYMNGVVEYGDLIKGYPMKDAVCYFFKDGYMVHDSRVTDVEGYMYYCGSDGIILTNTVTPDGNNVDVNGQYYDANNKLMIDPDYVSKTVVLVADLKDHMPSEPYNPEDIDQMLAYMALRDMYKSKGSFNSADIKSIYCFNNGNNNQRRQIFVSYYNDSSHNTTSLYTYEGKGQRDYTGLTDHYIHNIKEIVEQVKKDMGN